MVDEACYWDEHTKPVNLVTRLCVQAYSLYRSVIEVRIKLHKTH